jgi:hypothetical protein
LKTDLTPLLSMQLFGIYQDDSFMTNQTQPSTAADAAMPHADAVVTGTISGGYRDMQSIDP